MLAGADFDGKQRSLNGTVVNGRVISFAQAGGSSLAGPMWKAAMGPISQWLSPATFDRPPQGQPRSEPKKKPKSDEGEADAADPGDDEDE